MDTDTPNPFLTDPKAVEGVQHALESVIRSNSLVIALDMGVATQYTNAWFVSLAGHLGLGDRVTACRSLLFEVARHIAEHVPPGASLIEEHSECDDPDHDHHHSAIPDADLITASGNAWYVALVRHDFAAADNVLKALAATVPYDRQHVALSYVGTVALVSLGASLRMNMMLNAHDDDGHECGPECVTGE